MNKNKLNEHATGARKHFTDAIFLYCSGKWQTENLFV